MELTSMVIHRIAQTALRQSSSGICKSTAVPSSLVVCFEPQRSSAAAILDFQLLSMQFLSV